MLGFSTLIETVAVGLKGNKWPNKGANLVASFRDVIQ